ncbi:MAG: arginyltransferase [Gammaproteobacteria bacterium]|nr:arginyltransferase [Gammaproteobacteria bacterium]
MNAPRHLQFFATPPHPCPYLPEQEAISLFAEPSLMDNRLYSRLALLGFRRSGSHVYRPACAKCQACVPVRIPVADFLPQRRDRRCLSRNADLTSDWVLARFSPEHFQLYSDYLSARHPAGGMDKPTPEHYRQFLMGNWSDTWFLELRLDGHLIAVAVADLLADGLSAVYSFYTPDLDQRGLGNYCILRLIEHTQARGLPYLYLGYWIQDCTKMAYKGRFRPLETLINDSWIALP